MTPRVYTVERPYLLTFHASGHTYPLTSEEAQRLLDEYPVVTATKYRVVLPGHNTPDPTQRATLRPATLGGGPAFEVSRSGGPRPSSLIERVR
jgi:hypothetical protein